MKKRDVGPPPVVNARWLQRAAQPKGAGAPPTAIPPIVNARWLAGPVQPKSAPVPRPAGPALPLPHQRPGIVRPSAPVVLPRSGGAIQLKEDLTARNIADVRKRVVGSHPAAGNPVGPRTVQRAMAVAQAVPPYNETKEEWASGDNLEDLRAWRGEDAQDWLETQIRNLTESEGTYGNQEIFDAFIARNYAVVELTAAGVTYIGKGVSASALPGVHGERQAFRDAVQQLPGAPYDWTQATAANLWAVKGARVSRILSDRELCKGTTNCCANWAAVICGGNGITTPVYFGVYYNPAGKKELYQGIKSQLIHYLSGQAKEYFTEVTRK
ncbi:hypothetical protein Q9Q95_16920 [Sphingomonas sp. DG1-23]|uniref:hypothetical protein n=1 Tax=Sphingomonas sp. DG1-23 TaxID=3068316 RepID=UPI00273D9C13|nr:hypothetical protein [Sphingomonas sp. DG1-23]MDP5280614.1 hypothetical protein [Sphingomonas sp. DG1-23]